MARKPKLYKASIDTPALTRKYKFKPAYKLPSGVEINSCPIVGIYRVNNDPGKDVRVLITAAPGEIDNISLVEWNLNAAPLVIEK